MQCREQMMQQMAQARVSFGFMGQSEEDQKGLRVTQVLPNSAAAKAGIQAGDVVMAVEQNKVQTQAQLFQFHCKFITSVTLFNK